MTQSQQLRKLAARSATAFLLAALCVFPLYIDKFSNLGVVKFTGICTLSWAFALWLGALACVGARPDPGRLPWKADPALWALGAVTASGVVSTVLSLSPGASFWGLGGYYGGCMMVLFTAAGYLAVRAFAPQKILNGLTFCVGVTTALVTVLACAQKWYQDKKGWATGVAGVAMGLSGAFFTVFVRGVGGAWGIRVCFAALGAVMLVVCGAGALILQDPPPKAQSGPPQPGLDYKQMLRTPQYKLCAAAVALSAPAVLLFSPEIFKIAAERGLPESAAPYSIVLGSAASAAGRMLLPAVSDRLGRKPVLYAVYLGLAAGSAWFAFAGQWWVLAAYAVLTFFYSGGAAVQPSFNTDLFGLPHAGVNYGFIALGMSGGSVLSYIGAQALPLAARHWLAGICAAAGLICVSLVKPVENG